MIDARHERTTPAIIKINIVLLRPLSSFRKIPSIKVLKRLKNPGRFTFPINLSVTIGKNSIYNTVKYIITQIPTSNRAEFPFHITRGCQM